MLPAAEPSFQSPTRSMLLGLELSHLGLDQAARQILASLQWSRPAILFLGLDAHRMEECLFQWRNKVPAVLVGLGKDTGIARWPANLAQLPRLAALLLLQGLFSSCFERT